MPGKTIKSRDDLEGIISRSRNRLHDITTKKLRDGLKKEIYEWYNNEVSKLEEFKKREDEFDGFYMAAGLIKHGRYDKARSILEEIEAESYHTTRMLDYIDFFRDAYIMLDSLGKAYGEVDDSRETFEQFRKDIMDLRKSAENIIFVRDNALYQKIVEIEKEAQQYVKHLELRESFGKKNFADAAKELGYRVSRELAKKR